MVLSWPLTARSALVERVGRRYADGDSCGVVLTGPAGVGKTRLAHELVSAAAGRSTAWVAGHPATQPIPLGAFAHLLPAELTRDVGIDDDDRAGLFHRARLFFTETRSERQLLVVDDVDQLDDTSLALLLPLTLGRSIFLVATIRSQRPLPPVIATLLKDGHLTLEQVPALAPDEVAALLRQVLGGPVDVATVDMLATASGGNLQVLRELVHGSLNQDRLRFDEGVWTLQGLATSATLEELVTSQLADLDDSAAGVLEMLAVAGSMGLADVESVADAPLLMALTERGLIDVSVDDRRTRVSVSHPMYGEVIRSRLNVLRQRQLQRTLGDHLAQHGARRRGDMIQLALWRLEGGGQIDAELLVSAGRLALLNRDSTLAVRLARAAADRGSTHDATLLIVEAAVLRADAAALEEAVAGAWQDPSLPERHRSQLARRLATSRFWRGDLDGALEAVESAERVLREPSEAASVAAARALLLANNGRPQDALDLVATLGDVDDPRARIELATAKSTACLSMGRFTEAIEVARAGAAAHAELPPWLARRGMAAHLINEAHALGYSGRFAEARAVVHGALSGARNVGANAAVVWFDVVLGEIERDSGHGSAAVDHFTAATELADTAGQQAALVWAWVGVAQGHLLLGHAEPAAVALARADGCNSPVATSWSTRERTRAWLMACRGDLRGARRLIAEVAEEIRLDRLYNFEGGLIHDLVRFGDPDAAVDRLSELAELMDGPYIDALALHARAAATGDLATHDQAVETFEAMECLVLGAEAAIEAAELHRSAGDQRAAAAMAQRAQRMLARAGGARTPGLLRGSGVEPLSVREREVALLAAGGLASKEIAARLVVSKRTVDSHLDRIYRKLGISTREQLSSALLSDNPDHVVMQSGPSGMPRDSTPARTTQSG